MLGGKQIGKRILTWLILILLLPTCSFAEDDSTDAEDLSRFCHCTLDSQHFQQILRALSDANYNTECELSRGQRFSVSWDDEVKADSVFVEFSVMPGSYRVLQFDGADECISEEDGHSFIQSLIPLKEEARTLCIEAEGFLRICTLRVYGKGEVANAHPWDYSVKKLDYLVIAMHPDDDVLFMGAIVPTYSAEYGMQGRIFYATPARRKRQTEALNGAWTMGLRNVPEFGPFSDIPQVKALEFADRFEVSEIITCLVRVIRKHRPEVVFSHDLKGEYGHWQHRQLAIAVQKAVPLAADDTYDRESAAQYGIWQVKKLYLHLYPNNQIEIPSTVPLLAFDGKSAEEVAADAFLCHASQHSDRHAVRNEGVYSLSDFGLAYTVVGEDTPGKNDPFEHIPVDDLSQSWKETIVIRAAQRFEKKLTERFFAGK